MSRSTSGTSDARPAWPLLAALAVLATPCLPAIAGAQDNKPQSTGQAAGQIVSQPARDVGIAKTKVPPRLAEIGDNPYAMRGAGTCRQIASSIATLNEDLGPDYSGEAAPQKRNVAKAGGAAVVNSLIPFRGLVREVSGAGPAERRVNAAIDAGIARRGFLRGLQRAKGCR